jgi:hypothetical protein
MTSFPAESPSSFLQIVGLAHGQQISGQRIAIHYV